MIWPGFVKFFWFSLKKLHRLLPPTAPEPGQLKSKVFCNMFRPELLKRLKRQGIAAPLSSDAFAGWGLTDPLRRQREHDIRAATNFLFDVVIPEVCFLLLLLCCQKKKKKRWRKNSPHCNPSSHFAFLRFFTNMV